MRAALGRYAGLQGRDVAIFAVILAVALLGRIAVVAATPDYQPAFDSGDYVRHAESIAAGAGYPDSAFAKGGGPSAFRPPLYPYLLGGVHAVVGESVTAGRLLGAVFGALAVLLLALVAGALWGSRPALAVGAIAAVAPGLVLANAALITEPLFIVLELGVVACVLAYRRAAEPDWRWAAGAGALCGLAALTRSNGLLLLIPAGLGLWAARPRRTLAMPAVAVAVAALIILPWTVRNAVTFDRFVPIATQSGFALAGEYNDEARTFPGHPASWFLPSQSARYAPLYARGDLDEAELDAELRRQALAYVRADPAYVLTATAYNTGRALELVSSSPVAERADLRQRGLGEGGADVARISFFALALAATGGAFLLARARGALRATLWIWLVPLLMLGAALPILGTPRYRIPVEPFVVLLAGYALTHLRRPRLGGRGVGVA